MEILSSKASNSRALFSGRRKISFRIEAKNSLSELSRIAFELQKLLSTVAPDESLVTNLKGINDELFRFTGRIPLDEDDIQKRDGMHFEFSINSHFEKLKDPGTLIHSINHNLIGDLPEVVSPKDLTWLAPVFPQELHFGIELYAPHYFSNSLGFGPVIREWIKLGITSEKTSLETYAEVESASTTQPIGHTALWEGLCNAFLNTKGISLREIYTRSIG